MEQLSLTPQFLTLLRCQSLTEVMAAMGHYPVYIRKSRAYYLCPFHDDHHPSFSVEVGEEGGMNGVLRFNCPSCGVGGSGSDELLRLLMGKPAVDDEVRRRLCQIFNLVVPGGEDREFFSRRSEAAPQREYSFVYSEGWNRRQLEAIGCQSRMVYANQIMDDGTVQRRLLKDSKGNPRLMYSFGDGFYQNDTARYEEDENYVNFNASELERVFNLRPVDSFTTAAKENSKGELKSYRISSSEAYPIFNFVYGDKHHPWGKKYEPYYRGGKSGTKFMFWYSHGAQRVDTGKMVYGDVDVMRYMETGNVNDIQETKTGEHRRELAEYNVEKNGEVEHRRVFENLVICSGPRDAISVYFHSNAHVVWFNSESYDIPFAVYSRLRRCCKNLHICYDIDFTGREQANRLAMKFLGLRVIRLPRELEKVVDPRTGKAGKDAENFFNLYTDGNRYERFQFYGNVEERFENLMEKSVDMQFFTERWKERKVKGGDKEGFYTYEISGNSAIQLAGARHIYRYNLTDEKFIYVRCDNNVVDIITEKDIVKTVRGELRGFASTIQKLKNYKKLCDAITKSGELDKGVCEQLDDIDLNFKAWDADTEYFPFRNGAVKVTADRISVTPYKDAPYHFFRRAIIDRDFKVINEPTFRIERNTEGLAKKRQEVDALKTKGMTDEEREMLESRYLEYEKLWGWRLVWLKPYEQQPIAVKFVYETGHIYYDLEKKGIRLTPEQQQEQDLHFICKCNTFGYWLSRHRDPAMPYMVQFIDYTCMSDGKSSGRTGKTALASLINCLRQTITVSGKEMKLGDNMEKNFAQFRLYVHSNILIDDIRLNADSEQFYNLNTRLNIKTLYEDSVTVEGDIAPKIGFTSNKKPDMSSSSTMGRFMLCPVGGPIGIHKRNGQTIETSIRTLFGCNIPDGLNDMEYSLCQNFLLWCLQFYFQHKQIIRPYTGYDNLVQDAAAAIGNKDFTDWANEYFSDDAKFGEPLNRREIFLDYYEWLGQPKSIFRNNPLQNQFKDYLRRYCAAMGYIYMPSVVYKNRGTSDEKEQSVRLTMWSTEKDADGMRTMPLRWKKESGQRCIYIYARAADVPTCHDDVLKPSESLPGYLIPTDDADSDEDNE